MAVLEPYIGDFYLWKFLPSQVAAIIFLALFLVLTTLHFWRIYQLRSWFCLPFAIGCVCKHPSPCESPQTTEKHILTLRVILTGEIIGYASRTAAYNNTSSITIYVIQIMFLVIAPAFFAASVYMTLSRIMRSIKAEHLSIIRIDWLTKTFVIGDILSLGVQGGASSLTSNIRLAKTGNNLVVAGLFIQLFLLGVFLCTAIIFQSRLRKQPTRESNTTKVAWKQTLYMIYAVSALIFARSVFRVVEYIQGLDGYSLGHEWTLYVFDSLPMFIVAVVFLIWFPGYLRPAAGNGERLELDDGGATPGGSSDGI